MWEVGDFLSAADECLNRSTNLMHYLSPSKFRLFSQTQLLGVKSSHQKVPLQATSSCTIRATNTTNLFDQLKLVFCGFTDAA